MPDLPPEDEGTSQAWLASYADAMTLLLAFFIMMFAFALVDEGKFFDLKVGVQAALGVPDPVTDHTDSILGDGTGITPAIGLSPVAQARASAAEAEAMKDSLESAGTVTPDNAEELQTLLESEFTRAGASDYVEVGIDERGVFVRFDGRVLFASGSAELDQNGLTLLATAADVLRVVDNLLEIEGHTDDRPTGSRWPSNWELSSARASRVVRWMIEPGALPAPQMVAVGRSDTRPRASNSTAEGRQQNRRVEIVVRVPGIAESDVDLIGDDPAAVGEAFEGLPAGSDDGPSSDDSGDGTADADEGSASSGDGTTDAGDGGVPIDGSDTIEDPVGVDAATDPGLPSS